MFAYNFFLKGSRNNNQKLNTMRLSAKIFVIHKVFVLFVFISLSFCICIFFVLSPSCVIIGLAFWKQNFFPEESVDWDEFIPRFYAWMKQPIPKDPTALGDNPTASELANASLQQLQKLEKAGNPQAVDELRRRSAQGFSAKKTNDSQMYSVGSVQEEELDDAQKEYLCLKGLLYVSSKNEEGIVDTDKFGKLLAYFGCPSDGHFLTFVPFLLLFSFFLSLVILVCIHVSPYLSLSCLFGFSFYLTFIINRRISDLLREDYFHGYVNGKQAEVLFFSFFPPFPFLISFLFLQVLLCNKPRGTFLVRFSAGRWGQGSFISIYPQKSFPF